MSSVADQFAGTMESLAPPGAPLVAAVSGGLDSMVLLDLLSRWKKAPVIAAHFNHRLRGSESDEDEAFVAARARALGLPFRGGSGDVRAHADGISIEMAARDLRHKFLAEVARESKGAVVLAHHADDQIELFVLRLQRGIEGPGLGGMRTKGPSPADPSITLLRPLLEVRKSALLDYAGKCRLEWREDSSNRELHAERNRIRHCLLPALKSASGPRLESELLDLIHRVREQSDTLRGLARAWLGAAAPPFAQLHRTLQREIAATQLVEHRVQPTSALLAHLIAKANQAISVDPRQRVWLDSRGKLQVVRAMWPGDELELDLTGDGAAVFAGLRFSWRRLSSANIAPAADEMIFDADRVGSAVILRHWRKGDRVQLSGRSSLRPLHEMFSRNKIPRAQRHRAVVAATEGGEIFWVEGLRVTERFKIAPTTRRFLQWSWQAQPPETK